jgi:hypothetical protein
MPGHAAAFAPVTLHLRPSLLLALASQGNGLLAHKPQGSLPCSPLTAMRRSECDCCVRIYLATQRLEHAPRLQVKLGMI